MTSFSGIEVQVMSTHVDLFGHLNHARYLEYLEWARFAWAAHHGFPIERMIEEGYGPAIVRANVTWRRECRLGDRLRVTVQPLSARRGIGKLHQEVWKGEELCLDAEMSFVMFDLKARKALELPEAFLALVRE